MLDIFDAAVSVLFSSRGGKENKHELANDEIRAFCRKYKAPWIKSLFHDVRLWWGIRAVYDETCMNCECSAAHARVVAAAHMRTPRNLYVELSCTQLLFTIRFQTCLGNVETTRIKYIGIFYHWNNSGNEILAKNLFLFQTVSTQVSSKDRIHAMCCLSRTVQQGRTFRIGGGLYCSKDSFGQDTNAASLGSKLSDDHTRQ